MLKWIRKIYKHRNFLLFLFVFSYVESIYIRTVNWKVINFYTFTPDGAIGTLIEAGVLFAIIHYFLKKWQNLKFFDSKEMLKIFGISLIVYLIVIKIIGFLIVLAFGTVDRNFNQETFFFSLFANFLHGFIYGSFLLSYYYFNKSKNYQLQLANYNLSLAESKMYQLKSQLNPHFLFNNLNILDQLIEEDKNKASDFLNEFAEIYRYVLQATDRKLVTIKEELQFAKQYFQLIKYKYGNSYQMEVENNCRDGGYVIPLTLQLLIENAVKHNLGTEKNPVRIDIKLTDVICVSNNINLKQTTKQQSGRGISNLKEQYKLLSSRPLTIGQAAHRYTVTIPVINSREI